MQWADVTAMIIFFLTLSNISSTLVIGYPSLGFIQDKCKYTIALEKNQHLEFIKDEKLVSGISCLRFFTNLRIVYLLHILIAGRIQNLCSRGVNQKVKNRSPFDRGDGVKSYLGNVQCSNT